LYVRKYLTFSQMLRVYVERAILRGKNTKLISEVVLKSYPYSFSWMPKSHNTASFLYLRSPLELILIAGNFPRFPHLLIVRGETRSMSATSLTVRRSGSSSSFIFFFGSAIFQKFRVYRILRCYAIHLLLFSTSFVPDLLL